MRTQDKAKAGRHADDFLVAGPRESVDELLAEMGNQLKLSDVVKLYNTGDEGTFLSMQIRKIEGGYTIKGKTSLIEDVLVELGLETAKPSLVPETKNEIRQKDDDELLSSAGHSTYRTCVGKLLQLSSHRPDIQHGVGALSRGMAAPTQRDQRRLKKMARYLAGTRDVEMVLKPDKQTKQIIQCYTDADWADDKDDRISISGGVLKYYGCTVLSWARRQGCVALSSAESELYALGSGAAEALGLASLISEWHENVTPVLASDSSSALHIVKKRGPGKMKHIEIRFLALQQWREQKRLEFEKVHTDDNEADMLTKPMSQEKLVKFSRSVGLVGGPFRPPPGDGNAVYSATRSNGRRGLSQQRHARAHQPGGSANGSGR